jgi:hypothetical protein
MKGGKVPSGETMETLVMGPVRRDFYDLVDAKRNTPWVGRCRLIVSKPVLKARGAVDILVVSKPELKAARGG